MNHKILKYDAVIFEQIYKSDLKHLLIFILVLNRRDRLNFSSITSFLSALFLLSEAHKMYLLGRNFNNSCAKKSLTFSPRLSISFELENEILCSWPVYPSLGHECEAVVRLPQLFESLKYISMI